MTEFKAGPPLDPAGAPTGGAPVFALIREDIIRDRSKANERLIVADLAGRRGMSTDRVREALSPARRRCQEGRSAADRWMPSRAERDHRVSRPWLRTPLAFSAGAEASSSPVDRPQAHPHP